MLKNKSVVNVERRIVGMRQHGEWPSGLKRSDEVGEVPREDCPDESGKSPLRPSTTPLIGKEGIEHLSQS
jgi:hypothetical protein